MQTIEIDKKPPIFDHPEYCGNMKCPYEYCGDCHLFHIDERWYPLEEIIINGLRNYKKLDECKAWHKDATKLRKIVKCKTCGNELGFNGSHYFHKNHEMIHTAIPDK